MQLSVVILNYNVRFFLELCLESVQRAVSGIAAEIIVVDNNSPDDSCAMVREKFPNVILIENPENSGFPKGNNMGVAVAQGEYICILNPDTVVAEDTFSKILDFAKSKTDLGIVGCKLIDGAGNFLPESKRGIPTPFVAMTKIFGLYKIFPSLFGKYYALHLNERQTGETAILVGAFMVMKREMYIEVGGFDEDCFMYSDDIDLSYMILKTGRKNYYFAETTVLHYKGESTVRDGLYVQRFREAMNFFYRKHFRVSAVFDTAMRFGGYLFALRKKRQAVTHRTDPDTYIYVSEQAEKAADLQRLLAKKVIAAGISSEKKLNSFTTGNSCYVFDVASLKFGEILGSMQQWRNKKHSFRMLLNNVLIGSDSSNDRGEVKTL